MRKVAEHIEYIKGKPHHVRKRVAYATAAGGAGIIGLIWFVGNLSFGTFAIPSNSFADTADMQSSVIANGNDEAPTGLAGAAAALRGDSEPARIEIVDAPFPNSKKQAEQTTIPF
jgi:hypothetical protein